VAIDVLEQGDSWEEGNFFWGKKELYTDIMTYQIKKAQIAQVPPIDSRLKAVLQNRRI